MKASRFLNLTDYPGGNVNTDSQLVREMTRCGFILGDDVDELSAYGDLVRREKLRGDFLKLVIAPTLDCNFSCRYCFEHRRNVSMSCDIQEAVILHVRKKLEAGPVSHSLLCGMAVNLCLSRKLSRGCRSRSLKSAVQTESVIPRQ